MDSSGRIHMLEDTADLEKELRGVENDRAAALGRATLRHTGFVTKEPMPEKCDARRVLGALDKVADRMEPVSDGDAALLPLTPFERGYVLGVLAEYRAWRATR